MKQNVRSEWENEISELNNRYFPFFIYGSIIGLLLFSVVDFYIHNIQWFFLLICRAIVCGIGLLLLWLNRKKKLAVQKALFLFMLLAYLMLASGAVVQNTTDQLLTWNVGSTVAAFFWPYFLIVLPPKPILFLNSFYAITYLLFYIFFSKFSLSTLLVHGGIFVGFGIIASFILNYSRYRIYFSNFLLKQNIQLYNKQLELANNKLADDNMAKDKFISVLAHDLRGAVSGVAGVSELLKENINEYGKEEINELVNLIYNKSKSSFYLLEELLEWAKIRQHQTAFNPANIPLVSVAESAVHLLADKAQVKKIQIVKSIPENICVYADTHMLNTILRNLISNAIKFTPECGQISLSANTSNNMAVITVADTGLGMDAKTVQSLFKIGYTKSKPGTDGERGTGYGLLLCNEFVQKHGGLIQVESEPGKGSCFTFTIPLCEAKKTP